MIDVNVAGKPVEDIGIVENGHHVRGFGVIIVVGDEYDFVLDVGQYLLGKLHISSAVNKYDVTVSFEKEKRNKTFNGICVG